MGNLEMDIIYLTLDILPIIDIISGIKDALVDRILYYQFSNGYNIMLFFGR